MTSRRPPRIAALRHSVLIPLGLIWLVPLYVIVVNAFKPNDAILTSPFAPSHLTLTPVLNALHSPDFNILAGYAVTATLVVMVNVVSVVVCAPAAYVIARRASRVTRIVLMYLFAGAFIPAVVLVIPQVYVLRSVGLMGTVLGLVLVLVTMTVPVSMFAYVPYVRSIPTEIDEAAAIDGAGRLRTFWSILFPLMRPAVLTVCILNTTGVWENFIQPFIILGPGSRWHTVTTAIYGAVGPYQTDYSIVYPNLLLVIVPLLAFYLLLQRQLVGGLAGSLKG